MTLLEAGVSKLWLSSFEKPRECLAFIVGSLICCSEGVDVVWQGSSATIERI